MRILSNTMLTLFFLFIAGLVVHGVVHADDSGKVQKAEHSIIN